LSGPAALLRDHLTGVFRFGGREPRRMFWPWVGCVMATQMIVSMIVMVPIMTGIVRRTNAFAAQHPDRVRIMSAPGQYHMQIDGPLPPDLFMRDMSWFLGGTCVVSLLRS
jgi:uncharacterized membrane protein YhaH (DUF805 family)